MEKMNHNLKGLHKSIFYFALTIVLCPSTYSTKTEEDITTLKVNVTGPKLGEYCRDDICPERQFCDINFVCNCLPGYRVHNDDCVRYAGENEKCRRQEDCEGKLICFKGICRRPTLNDDFAMLAKICVGVTVITIIIAIFSSLLKCLIKYDSGTTVQRQSDASSNFTPPFRGNPYSPAAYEVREEKPPSYEECIRSEEPPPYVISSGPTALTSENSIAPSINPINLTTAHPQTETPLNIQNLNQKTISK